ncbi:hypothetical protein DPMN_090777 [Dreissena polymorpha]|uniref:Uncharacterized protein n=1 Tax=Dreissena polymorpha TaxID=45954 RepID=A0A9D4QYI9_DREPO|nr:hypothetical protein DPMN_090777 [Dreissena polymorpha]
MLKQCYINGNTCMRFLVYKESNNVSPTLGGPGDYTAARKHVCPPPMACACATRSVSIDESCSVFQHAVKIKADRDS